MKKPKARGKKPSKKHVGVFIFLFINGTFGFLLLSPYIPNYIGEYLDNQLLNSIDNRIIDSRTAIFALNIKYINGTAVNDTPIYYNLSSHDFVFGGNLFSFNACGSPSDNANYKNFFKSIFNLGIIRFYWAEYEPIQGDTAYRDAINDDIITWGNQSGVETKGHPLAWVHPAGQPGWLPEDENLVLDLLKTRIQDILTRYQNKTSMWDVVNEPMHYTPFAGQSTYDYTANCLEWAAEVDPDAYLMVNDFGILGHDFGGGPFYNLMDSLKKNGVPISAMGFQAHEYRTDWIPATEMWDTLEAYSDLDIPIHITELMITSAPLPITNSWKKGLWSEENQGEYLERLYKVCFAHPSVEGIIYWDFWDGTAWMEESGFFREDWSPKPVYTRLSNLINNEWHTEGNDVSDASGALGFNGFFGTYNISIPSLGWSGLVDFTMGGSRTINITI
ncbi:MAG: endo-1,4-beta-xylanase [Candidatus Hodarchaeota archaeon]